MTVKITFANFLVGLRFLQNAIDTVVCVLLSSLCWLPWKDLTLLPFKYWNASYCIYNSTEYVFLINSPHSLLLTFVFSFYFFYFPFSFCLPLVLPPSMPHATVCLHFWQIGSLNIVVLLIHRCYMWCSEQEWVVTHCIVLTVINSFALVTWQTAVHFLV